MNKHKAKCDKLKKIRKSIADKIGVDLHQVECTYEGDCTGTCPKCKQEEDILNRALIQKTSAVAMGAVAAFSLAACTPVASDPSNIQGGITIDEAQRMGILDSNGRISRFAENNPEDSLGENTLSGDVEIAPDDSLDGIDEATTENETDTDESILSGSIEMAPEDGLDGIDEAEDNTSWDSDLVYDGTSEDHMEVDPSTGENSDELITSHDNLAPLAGVLPYDG